jgi:hypothetical protein
MAEWQHFIDFQDGGGSHLGKWRYTSAFPFSDSSMRFPVWVQISSKSGDIWHVYSIPLEFSYTVGINRGKKAPFGD